MHATICSHTCTHTRTHTHMHTHRSTHTCTHRYVAFTFEGIYVKHMCDSVPMTSWGRVYYTNAMSAVPLLFIALFLGEQKTLGETTWSIDVRACVRVCMCWCGCGCGCKCGCRCGCRCGRSLACTTCHANFSQEIHFCVHHVFMHLKGNRLVLWVLSQITPPPLPNGLFTAHAFYLAHRHTRKHTCTHAHDAQSLYNCTPSTHTHAHSHTYTHAHSHTHTHTYTHTLTHTHTRTHTCAQTARCLCKQSHTASKLQHIHAQDARAHTHTHSHINTYAHTSTSTH